MHSMQVKNEYLFNHSVLCNYHTIMNASYWKKNVVEILQSLDDHIFLIGSKNHLNP